MSIERMADRALPLAERVSAAIKLAMESVTGTMDGTWSKRQNDLAERGCDALLADIAAADRLARAMFALDEASDAPIRLTAWRGLDPLASDSELVAAAKEATAAHLAYRARTAQGVG